MASAWSRPGPTAMAPSKEVLSSYRQYLSEERGLADKTVSAHLDTARCFCLGVAGTSGDLAGLTAADVTAYLVTACSQQGSAAAQKTASSVRSLLRYLHVSAITPTSLALAVPKVAGRRPGPQQAGLTRAEVTRLMRSCDRRRRVGRRDFAILMLLARLGLRAGEVSTILLEDLDWHHGELLVRGKGNRHERLPVACEVGAAVAAYLQRGRPRPVGGCREVFLRSRAPWTPLTLAGVQTVVRDAALRGGFPPFGPRRLRQYAATQMHRDGLSLAVVAEVLRHHDTRVTRLYVDVAPAALSELARAWPGGAP